MRTQNPARAEITREHGGMICCTHPQVVDNAPRWARWIVFDAITTGDEIPFRYESCDERFEVIERWCLRSDGSPIYKWNHDDKPEITSCGDALSELVTDYIARH